jgi:hypothetical protein
MIAAGCAVGPRRRAAAIGGTATARASTINLLRWRIQGVGRKSGPFALLGDIGTIR